MRRLRTLAAVVAALAVVVLTAGPALAQQVGDFFTSDEIARARDYNGTKYLLGFTALGADLLTLAILGLGRGSRWLARWSRNLTKGRWVRHAALLTVVVTAVPVVVTLPLALARNAHARRFGLATNTPAEFLRDVGVATGFAAATSLVAAVGFVALARRLPRAWPAAVALGGGALTFVLVFVFPVVYEPAFNTFEPVPPNVRARVLALADEAGVAVGDVLVSDASRRTTAHNAYVSGLGATKRVVLYDNLLNEAPPAEVDLVVAHELAHVVHGDVARGTALAVGGVIVGVAVLWLLLRSSRLRAWLGVREPGDPTLIPFLAFFLAATSLLTLPAQNAISRAQEARADATAIAMTGDPDTAVAVEVRLARENIADLEPNGFIRWAFFTHPATMERIRAALEGRP